MAVLFSVAAAALRMVAVAVLFSVAAAALRLAVLLFGGGACGRPSHGYGPFGFGHLHSGPSSVAARLGAGSS